MLTLPPAVQELKSALNRLPGIGPRSAERIALHLVQSKQDAVDQLIRSVKEAKDKVSLCETCGGLTETQPCPLCSNSQRQQECICVVVKPTDILTLEKSGVQGTVSRPRRPDFADERSGSRGSAY